MAVSAAVDNLVDNLTYDPEVTITQKLDVNGEDATDDATSIYDTVLQLKQQLMEMEAENALIKMQLNSQKTLLSQMQSSMLDNMADTVTRPMKVRKLSEDSKARIAFYHEHKNDAAVVEKFSGYLSDLGIKRVPWQLIRQETDRMFEEMRASVV